MIRKPKTILSAITAFINHSDFDNSKQIERQSIISSVSKELPWVLPISIDPIRNYLTKAGYLQKIKPGFYIRLKKIPEKMLMSELLNNAYSSQTK